MRQAEAGLSIAPAATHVAAMMRAADDLARFVTAQDAVLAQARREMSEGRKRSHWMWYVFPQLRGLGHSPTAQFYGLDGLQEARAYLSHPVLRPRLVDLTEVVNAVEGRSADQIFGGPDDLKFHSCVTLFAIVEPTASAFRSALKKYFDGIPDGRTRELLMTDQ